MFPEQDSNLGPIRIAVFEDYKATALTTQPPGLDYFLFCILNLFCFNCLSVCLSLSLLLFSNCFLNFKVFYPSWLTFMILSFLVSTFLLGCISSRQGHQWVKTRVPEKTVVRSKGVFFPLRSGGDPFTVSHSDACSCFVLYGIK